MACVPHDTHVHVHVCLSGIEQVISGLLAALEMKNYNAVQLGYGDRPQYMYIHVHVCILFIYVWW